jgi:hypothetical protein
MKAVFALVVLLSVGSMAFVLPSKQVKLPTQSISTATAPAPQDDKLCGICLNLMSDAMKEIVEIILNGGVIGGCGDICSKLPEHWEQVACDLICDIVGVDSFIHLIEKADLDPIYYCQLLKVCPIHDCKASVCANITTLAISPQSGPQGTTFNFDIMFQVFDQTGTGEVAIGITPPAGMPMGTGFLVAQGFQPQNYQERVQMQTQPSQQEPFSPGTYQVEAAVCEGQCGSGHPHSRVLAVKKGSFQITQ